MPLRLSRYSHLLLVWRNFHLRAQPHIERIQYPDGTLQRDAEVFVALVVRDLRFVNAAPLGQIALRDSLGNAQRNQHLAESTKVLQLIEFAPLQPLVALYFLFQLQVKGLDWIDDALDLVVG